MVKQLLDSGWIISIWPHNLASQSITIWRGCWEWNPLLMDRFHNIQIVWLADSSIYGLYNWKILQSMDDVLGGFHTLGIVRLLNLMIHRFCNLWILCLANSTLQGLTDASIYELSVDCGICWPCWRIWQSVYCGIIIQFIDWCICESINWRICQSVECESTNHTIYRLKNLKIRKVQNQSVHCQIRNSVDWETCQSINCRICQFVECRISQSCNLYVAESENL